MIVAALILALVSGICGRPAEAERRPLVPTHGERPAVGAIRWDAWIGDAPGSDVGRQVERALGPARWHSRLPFFAREVSDSSVEVRANSQSIMDREIAYAHGAGLDYWAFVMYGADDPMTLGGIDLYLRSRHHRDMHFAMIVQSYTFGEADIARLVGYFKDESYQTVAGGRPLLFLLGPQRIDDPKWPHVVDDLARLRAETRQAGVRSPYLVHMWGWTEAKSVADRLGLDAIGAYSLNFDDRAAPYGTLARKSEAKWDEWRSTGARVVPLVTAGWDRRPRVDHPVSWEPPDGPDAMERYYSAPTPDELAAHVKASLDWCARYPESAEAWTVVIYAWNEIDEGGWLVPSLWPDQGTSRLDAIRGVLRTWHASRRTDRAHRPAHPD
jgi:hypothetical protein